jgi:hypothetical protein
MSGLAFPGPGEPGMSLRHWTTVHAMPIAMDMMKLIAQTDPNAKVQFSPKIIAANARLIADAVIQELGLV